MNHFLTDLDSIQVLAQANEQENDAFHSFLKELDPMQTDLVVHGLNEDISNHIDCTACGNCCRTLMINVTPAETELLAVRLDMDIQAVKEKYIEQSQGGVMVINTIPCHFLSGSRCNIYDDRFTECRDFPHLHKPKFTARFFSTIMYYGMCPIIFNVVEALKIKLGFKIVTPSGEGNNLPL